MNPGFSLYLDLLRALAAIAVYIFHAQHFSGKAVPLVGQLGGEAVIVFFVLSGLLISYARKKHEDLQDFMVARFARLWSVCLPALVLTVMSDTAGQYLSLDAYSPMQPYNWFKWAASLTANATFLNQIWHLNIYPGTNGPFWSLSFEFWYYAIFAAGVYLRGWRRVMCLLCLGLIAGPKILVGLPVWLLGAGVYQALRGWPKCGPRAGLAIWLGSLGLACAFSYFHVYEGLTATFPETAQRASTQWFVNFWPASYLIGLIVAANIFGFSGFSDKAHWLLAKFSGPIRWAAGISFGLYLFHYPLMYLVKAALWSLGIVDGNAFVALVYAVPFVISAYVALLCERNKNYYSLQVKAMAIRLFQPRRAAQ
jgi:peptidoglycan/LPS O-acetylase OafA/YrhL